MRVLLHACCAPCLLYPLDDLRSEGHEVTAFFFNPNIHPYTEYLRRLDAFKVYTREHGVRTLNEEPSPGMEEWLREVVFREAQKCRICFNFRLGETARRARDKGFEAFSSTLLYSRFQKHDLLAETGQAIAEGTGVPFIYRDWRSGWNEGVRRYRTLGLYRQKYCGCIYSEKERALKIL
jgi:epoxyqueuosine reductase